MGADGGGNQAAEAGNADAVWPPPPTCPPVEAAAPRRSLLLIHLPFPQMPPGFGLPKWASSASFNVVVAFGAVLLKLHAPLFGKILIGLFVCGYSFMFLSLPTWAFFAFLSSIRRSLGQTPIEPATSWGYVLSALDGWMGMVPSFMFLVWGLSYLDIYHIRFINLVALAVWAAWFVMGCGVAVVNGVRYWLRAWRTSRGTGYE